MDSSESPSYDWASPGGLEKIRTTICQSYLEHNPKPFQLYNLVCILNWQDIICIMATGDGKLALIYILALVKWETVTVEVEPTNFLESDMVCTSNDQLSTGIC